LPTFLHAAFRQAINKLQDLAAAWNGQCVQASNVTESSRIRHALTGPAPVAILIRCFYLLEVSIMEFDILCERVHVLNQEELVYALGFFVFAFVLARPVTRVEVITKAEVHQYSMELAQKEHTEELLATTFEGHKTSSSYGSLLCLYPRWFVSILARYLRIIRPALLKTDVWGHTSHAKLFPASLTRYLNAFLMKTVGAALTANNIRQKVCECVGLLTPTDAFFDQRHALQATAAHQSVTSRVVDINYTWSTKAQREVCSPSFLPSFLPSVIYLFIYLFISFRGICSEVCRHMLTLPSIVQLGSWSESMCAIILANSWVTCYETAKVLLYLC
jgi:hypothetical protein